MSEIQPDATHIATTADGTEVYYSASMRIVNVPARYEFGPIEIVDNHFICPVLVHHVLGDRTGTVSGTLDQLDEFRRMANDLARPSDLSAFLSCEDNG